MITIIISAIKTANTLFLRFIQDYMSNIIIGTMMFPAKIIKVSTNIAYNELLTPIVLF